MDAMTSEGFSLEEELFQTMTSDSANVARLFGPPGSILRNNLIGCEIVDSQPDPQLVAL
jgi:hypothetical protein